MDIMKKIDKPSKFKCFQKALWVTVLLGYVFEFFLSQRGFYNDIPPLIQWVVMIVTITSLFGFFLKEATDEYESYIAYEAREDKKVELMESIAGKIKDESDENKRLTFSREYDRLPLTINNNDKTIRYRL